MTLTAKLSIKKLDMFPIMLPDDLLGQVILLSLDDSEHVTATLVPKADGKHVKATHVSIATQHNLDVNECFEKYQFPAIGCNCYANHIDLSKQEILEEEIVEEEIGEQFF